MVFHTCRFHGVNDVTCDAGVLQTLISTGFISHIESICDVCLESSFILQFLKTERCECEVFYLHFRGAAFLTGLKTSPRLTLFLDQLLIHV